MVVEHSSLLNDQLHDVLTRDVDRVGVIAATVTPDEMVEEVVSLLEGMEAKAA